VFLWLGCFCGWGVFVVGVFLWLGCFCGWGVFVVGVFLWLGCFCGWGVFWGVFSSSPSLPLFPLFSLYFSVVASAALSPSFPSFFSLFFRGRECRLPRVLSEGGRWGEQQPPIGCDGALGTTSDRSQRVERGSIRRSRPAARAAHAAAEHWRPACMAAAAAGRGAVARRA
jgi:hypothetical protein